MHHDQLTIHPMHVGFDTGKALIQGVEQGPLMLVVVVRVRMREGCYLSPQRVDKQ